MSEIIHSSYDENDMQIVKPYLAYLDRAGNENHLKHGVLELYKSLDKFNLQQLELALREMGSKFYLLSRDVKRVPNGESVFPFSEIKMPYYLSIGNGYPNARRILDTEGINELQNFERLQETGILVPRSDILVKDVRRPSINNN